MLANECRNLAGVALLVVGMLLWPGGCRRGPDPKQLKQAEIRYDIGIEDLRAGRIRKALANLLESEKLHPDFPDLQNALGLCYYLLQEYPRALQHFDRALQLKPGYSEVLNNKARVYIDQGMFRLARPLLEKALEDVFLKNRYLVESNLGWVLFNLGQKQQGYRYVKNSLAQNDKYCIGYHYLGLMYRRDKQLDLSAENLRQAIKHCPALLQAQLDLGKVLLLQGQLGEGCQALETCFKPSRMTPVGEECYKLFRGNCRSPETGE
ncbi:MAG: hypothetical protein DRI34_14635 [Deltaproteobacteria bacterium]|nr:MAG: hypothetical protein DRI34_14635 [Deltaproteobacteria bacterium]